MYAIAMVLAALFFAVLTLVLIEVRKYATGRSLIGRRRFIIRILGAALLLADVAAIFSGLFLLNLRRPAGHPWLWLGWWSGCIIVGFALMFLALADAKELEAVQGERERQLWRDFARELKPRAESEKGPDSDGGEADSTGG